MQTKYLIGKWLVFVTILIIGTSTITIVEPSDAIFTKMKVARGDIISFHDLIEIKYYDPNTLTDYPGWWIEPPGLWKEAIKLTQTELALYKNWNLTSIVIGFDEKQAMGPMNIRIFIYGKGDETHPGNIIVNDTVASLNETTLITVPLITPVSLFGYDEIWVAVEWIQTIWISHDYAFVDAGPAVNGKSDWMYQNNEWVELQPGIDTNWALGAVVEGQGLATIALGSIRGPIRIKTVVQNVGDVDANNVVWSIVVKGGILGKVNRIATGTAATLAAQSNLPINISSIIGFGTINILVKAQATNAVKVVETKSALLLGPLVVGIK